jgi:hypothetical protein
MHIDNFVRALIASSTLIGLATGCGSDPAATGDDLGSATIAITSVPSDASCIRITVSGSRTVVQRMSVTPGQSSIFTLSQLPAGNDTFLGEAFAIACSSIVAQSSPTWISDPVSAFVQNSSAVNVTLKMHKNGRAKVSVDFDDGGAECAVGMTYCPSGCANLSADLNNCGACGNVCAGGPGAANACISGVCVRTCNAGYADCDGDGICETDLTSPNNCGACGAVCPSAANANSTCQSGSCGWVCQSGYLNCDAQVANGCEANIQTSPVNCGGCGNVCASGICSAGVCTPSCSAGYADCNGDGICETSLMSSPTNCGACGAVCPSAANANAVCQSGGCGWVCQSGYLNCDGQVANGCEVNVQTSPSNCGGCGNVCASGICSAGVCVTVCNPGYADCNGDGICEASLSSPTSCGGCGVVCAVRPNARAICSSGNCGWACQSGYADCDGQPANGCEISLQTSPTNCGSCGHACATGVCSAGVCL